MNVFILLDFQVNCCEVNAFASKVSDALCSKDWVRTVGQALILVLCIYQY